MIFSGQYLTFQEYKDLDGTLQEVPFNILEFKARKEIDRLTFGRLIDVQDIPQEVKMCIHSLLNTLDGYIKAEAMDKSISSESIDGYSVSYNQISDNVFKTKINEIKSSIEAYLSNTVINEIPILYRGVEKC